MTVEEKVGQLFIVHFTGEEANANASALIQQDFIGGIIYYNWANGLNSPTQIQQLSSGLQALASKNRIPIPLLISVDQEGGRVARLTKGFTQFPGNMALAIAGDPELAEQAAFAMGLEMRAVGVNVNLAPVVDVVNDHSVIGIRSFGNDVDIAIRFAEKALEGFHKANIITALKHFPGYGSATVDPHEDLPILKKSKADLQKIDLQPFIKLCNASDMVMTAHLLVPALDPVHCTTLSKISLEGVLRKELGFQGIIISDSLVMQGALKNAPSIDEVTIRAFEAGCDLLILGGRQLQESKPNFEQSAEDIHRICQSMVAAVKSGRISEERLNRSVKKILKLKHTYLSFDSIESDLTCINCKDHRQLANKIAKLAIEVIQSTRSPTEPYIQAIKAFLLERYDQH